ncbi:MAG: hypothetical protein V4607_08710 [Pseudomonadota bacterium]
MTTKTGAGMKKISIRYLVASASLAAFPLVAMSASEGLSLRADESARQLEAQTKVNPFDAIALNNEAIKMSRDGSQLEAVQLLLRAHRLAPDNKAIERNYRELSDWMAKRTSSNQQPLDIDKAPRQVLPEPPPLWSNAAISGNGGRKSK